MRRAYLFTPALAALVLGGTPVSAEVIELAPSSPWNVDFGETKCRLARFFGEGEKRHILFFEQYWPDVRTGMTVAGPTLSGFRSLKPTLLWFNPDQEPQKGEPFSGRVDGFGDAVVYSSIRLDRAQRDDDSPPESMASGIPSLDKTSARQAQFVSIKQRGDEVRLKTGPLDAAFEVLDNCALDLIGSWGLDVEQHRTATRMPRWTNRDAVVRRIVATYPSDAAMMGEQAIIRMRVTVSAEGTVEDCAIINATQTQRLDSPACRSMALAKFEPALDAAGKPMRSYYAESIVYRMQR